MVTECTKRFYGFGVVVVLLAFFGSHANRSSAAPPTETSRAVATYYFELFSDIVGSCAIEGQDELTRAISQLNLERRKRPGPGDLAAAQTLAARYGKVYALARESLGVVQLVWDGEQMDLTAWNLPLELVPGLARTVLVEIKNESEVRRPMAIGKGRSIPVAAGEIRAFVVSITVADRAVRTHTLAIRCGPKMQAVELEVTVVQLAGLRGVLLDPERKAPFPGRVSVRGSDGILRHGDAHREIETVSRKSILQTGRNYQLPFFYSDGRFEVALPPGKTTITLERGYEHEVVTKTVTLRPGEVRDVTLSSGRFVNLREWGWISGDTHVHWAINGWNENEDLELLRTVQRAEDIQVINNLTLRHWNPVKGEFIAPTQYPMGPVPGHYDGEYHVQMGEEYRNAPFYGHLNFLNITNLIQPISTGDLMGPKAMDWPLNHTKILEARAQGGIVISAHGTPAEVPADVAFGIMDSIDQSTPDQYYALLNCGFRLPITTGSDHPARLVGHSRCYVKIDGKFSYAKWIEGIRAKRTFVTSGPLLFLNVNGRDIAGEVKLRKGEPIRVRANVRSRRRIGRLQIVSNNKVLKETEIAGREGELEFEMPADTSRWILARCSPGAQLRPLAGPDIAHTSAIYVEVDGRPIFVPDEARRFATRLRAHGRNVRKNALFENEAQRAEAVGVMERGATAFDGLVRTHAKWLRK
jgi:hypothetical protein